MNVVLCKQIEALIKNIFDIPIFIDSIEYTNKNYLDEKYNCFYILYFTIIRAFHFEKQFYLLSYIKEEINKNPKHSFAYMIAENIRLLLIDPNIKKFCSNFHVIPHNSYLKIQTEFEHPEFKKLLQYMQNTSWKQVIDCEICPKEQKCPLKLTHYLLDPSQWKCFSENSKLMTLMWEAAINLKTIQNQDRIFEWVFQNSNKIEDFYFERR